MVRSRERSVGEDVGENTGRESLAAALDELIVATSALVATMREADGSRERRVTVQLALALIALESTRGRLTSYSRTSRLS
jgi:hypothetical protein